MKIYPVTWKQVFEAAVKSTRKSQSVTYVWAPQTCDLRSPFSNLLCGGETSGVRLSDATSLSGNMQGVVKKRSE
jgi:hypothetical protein